MEATKPIYSEFVKCNKELINQVWHEIRVTRHFYSGLQRDAFMCISGYFAPVESL